jgi:hypothetical protein
MVFKETPMTDQNALRQLQCLSHPFVILLSIALALLVLFQVFVIVMLFFFHQGGTWQAAVSFAASGINLSVFASSIHSPDVSLDSLSFGQRAILALLAALCGTCGGFVIFHLRHLFALYSRGVVFAQDNIRHINRFGLWLVVAAVVVNGSGRVFFVVTGQHAHDTANAAMALVYGGMTYVIARVMELGRHADEERKEFV